MALEPAGKAIVVLGAFILDWDVYLRKPLR